jgi:hypothetical protein
MKKFLALALAASVVGLSPVVFAQSSAPSATSPAPQSSQDCPRAPR